MNTRILVATHKEYPMPKDDIYFPIQVGSRYAPRLECAAATDSEGNNISEKNKTFCELTAVYWAWKNTNYDYLGLCHFRRYFKGKKGIASSEEIESWLKNDVPMILPKARNYYIESNYNQYIHAHHENDLFITKKVISELFPEYIASWEKVMKLTKGHRYNMFIMKRELLSAYCEWLFSILFEVEKRLDITEYDDYNLRVFGFIGERLLDIWIDKNMIPYKERPVYKTEKENVLMKGALFVVRFIKGRYRDYKKGSQ